MHLCMSYASGYFPVMLCLYGCVPLIFMFTMISCRLFPFMASSDVLMH